MYLNIPTYGKDFSPEPEREWERENAHLFICHCGRAVLAVSRTGENAPWWADCDNPKIESVAWFWTAEQAQYWIEQEIKDYFA